MAIEVTEDTLRQQAKRRFDDNMQLLLRAVVQVMTAEINTLRALHSLPDRTNAQVKNAILSKIDSGSAG
jgi:hypothetical protein